MGKINRQWVPVNSHYFVVRADQISKSYRGGLGAFLEKYPGTIHNGEIVVLCSRSGMEFYDIESDLRQLDSDEFFYESYWDGIGEDVPLNKTFEMTPWLAGKWTGEAFLVSHSDVG